MSTVICTLKCYKMELKELGNKIAKVRISRNLSAYELSLRINRSASYISQAESGKVNISMKTFLEICKALETEPAEIFIK